MITYRAISIPRAPEQRTWWEGTTEVTCPCGGTIVWAEAGYVPGSRACRRCLVLYQVRGQGTDRRLVPQMAGRDGIEDAPDGTPAEELYHVPADLYPGFQQEEE